MIKHFLDEKNYPKDGSLKRLEQINKVSGVEYVAVMPEVHYKENYPAPTGIVVASSEMIFPQLIALVINCGMCIIKTPFKKGDLKDEDLDRIYHNLMKRISINVGSHPILSDKSVRDIFRLGSFWAIDNFSLDKSEAEFIEHSGNLFKNDPVEEEELINALPEAIFKIGRLGFNYMGGGGHFFELQAVEEILDDPVARILGLEKDNLLIMLHSDSGLVGGMVSQYFSYNRLINAPLSSRVLLGIKKWQYYLKHPSDFFTIPLIYRLVFRKNSLVGLPAKSNLARNYKISSYAAANFGYVKRMALTQEMREAIREVIGDKNIKMPLIYDVSHNLIHEEQINGQKAWVHRHGCCAAFPAEKFVTHPIFSQTGQPFPLPGSMATSSFICVGLDGSKDTFYSACHGSGNITDPIKEVRSPESIIQELKTKKIKLYKHGKENLITHNPARFKNARSIAATLEKFNIAKAVARVFPLAVLKG